MDIENPIKAVKTPRKLQISDDDFESDSDDDQSQIIEEETPIK